MFLESLTIPLITYLQDNIQDFQRRVRNLQTKLLVSVMYKDIAFLHDFDLNGYRTLLPQISRFGGLSQNY